ncbi:VOC family protein [Stutzerimonas kirkiae]|nr:VOC family protein [Stutzerimonas kirkiae]
MTTSAHITGFDHLVILVKDLESAQRRYSQLGFRLSPRNRHPQSSTANHVAVFQRDYLELLTVTQADALNQPLADLLEQGGDGLRMLALGSADAEAAKAHLQAQAIDAFGPFALSRKGPGAQGGEVELLFNVLLPQAVGAPLEAQLFFCQHLTPERVYQADAPAHPNSALGVRAITVPVADLQPVESRLRALAGGDAYRRQDDALELNTGSAPLRFVATAHWPHGQASGLVSFDSADLDATRDWLRSANIAFEELGEAIRIAADDAHNVVLEFQAS